MPIPTIPKSLYPLVPNAPGVPALLRNGAQLLDTLTQGAFGIGKALTSLIGAEPIKWGVFDSSGNTIAPYDSVFAVNYQNEARISDYPLEKGSFASYNKVDNPFDVLVTLNCGGTEDQRAAFIIAIENARRSLEKFTVMTPEYTYRNINFVGVSWQRSTREGAYMITAHLTGREIRERASAAYSTPKDVGAYDVKAQGQIQVINDPTLDASGIA